MWDFKGDVFKTDAGFCQSTDRDLSTVVFDVFCGGRDTAVVIISKAFDFLVHLWYPLGAHFSDAHANTRNAARTPIHAMPRTHSAALEKSWCCLGGNPAHVVH